MGAGSRAAATAVGRAKGPILNDMSSESGAARGGGRLSAKGRLKATPM